MPLKHYWIYSLLLTGILIAIPAIAKSNGQQDISSNLIALSQLADAAGRSPAERFAEDAADCNPAVVDAAIADGINVDTISDPDKMALDLPGGSTALSRLAGAYCKTEADRIATAKRLLAYGADPNHQDVVGATPLFEVRNVTLLNLLLAAGADFSIKDKHGETAILTTVSDAVALRLLQVGTNPDGVDFRGNTLAQRAADYHMRRTLRWLKVHRRVPPATQ
ncbi:hypothetical protein FBZ89_111124 [Nitrospirillum amazonense]|uniref:Uncharacterized protein n=1 Tax=Nitrospirillum amazonense TaxID=28077 RepID=A0A560F6R1_9PROT|nr:hypothetical protein [Nitrospirillum amazonense]TWB17273.1 hypothetical protein FBZ89_111124 [Nitrospirillum amazonense]